MTAVSLLDILANGHAGSDPNDVARNQRCAALAGRLVASTLSDLERLRDYERTVVAPPDAADDDAEIATALLRSLHSLYAEWADEAEQVAARARALIDHGLSVPAMDQLEDAIGRARARLSVSVEQLAAAMHQAAQGQFVPAKELRDELHARLRR